jgi:hypothetical protein
MAEKAANLAFGQRDIGGAWHVDTVNVVLAQQLSVHGRHSDKGDASRFQQGAHSRLTDLRSVEIDEIDFQRACPRGSIKASIDRASTHLWAVTMVWTSELHHLR